MKEGRPGGERVGGTCKDLAGGLQEIRTSGSSTCGSSRWRLASSGASTGHRLAQRLSNSTAFASAWAHATGSRGGKPSSARWAARRSSAPWSLLPFRGVSVPGLRSLLLANDVLSGERRITSR